MGVLGRLLDARNTVEGKVLSVIMAVLLVVSTFNVSAWAAEKSEDAVADVATEVNDKPAPAADDQVKPVEADKAQPAQEQKAPEAEAEKAASQLETPAPRPEAEPEAAPAAPAEEKAADVTLKLKLQNAAVTYGGKTLKADAKELTVPADQVLKFTVAADEGFELAAAKAVTLTSAAGVQCELAANAAGEYTVAAEKVEAGAVLAVTAVATVADEPEAPVVTEPATPAPTQPETPADDPAEQPGETTVPETPVTSEPEAPTVSDAVEGIFDALGFGSSTLEITDENNNKKNLTVEVGGNPGPEVQ